MGGETISEAGNGGGKIVSYVRVGKSILAHLIRNSVWQPGGGYSFDAVYYEHTDSSGMSYRMTERQMPFGYGDYSDARQAEFDAGGTNVGLVTNYNPPPGPNPEYPPLEDTSPLWINGQRVTATLDGMAISWQMVRNLIDHGAAVPVGIDNILRAARGRDINLQYTGSGRYTFRDFTYDGPGSRYIGVTFGFSFNFGIQQTQQDGLLATTSTISTNITPRRLPQADCDFLINHYFGNINSVVATKNEPKNHLTRKGADYEVHLAGNGALHIYGNESGTARNSPLYLPLDSNGKPPTFLKYPLSNAHEEQNSTTWTNVFRWRYNNGLVIEFFHVGGTSEGRMIPPRTTSTLGNFPNQTNSAGSIQIGYIGGLGGNTSPDYLHSHLNFKVNGNRVDPRYFFCAGYSK